MRIFILVLSVLFLGACERIPDWERRADKTRSLELATRLAELRKWLFACRGTLPQAEGESSIAPGRAMDIELEAVQDYFRAKNLSSIDSGESKTPLGTAFLWDSEGHAVLGFRSTFAPKEVECRRSDGEWLKANVVGIDSAIDFGVLKIEELTFLKQENPWLSRSAELKEDETYYAVASPLPGFVQRLPLSLQAVGYHFNSGMDTDLLSFLPSVTPLFLGGLVVDERLSIVSFILPQWTGWTFALSVERMRQSVNSLIRGESLRRPFLGMRLTPETIGFVVQQVEVGGPAYRGGLRSQDILLEWDGRKLDGSSDWKEAVAKDINRVIAIKFKRGSSVIESSLKVAARD